MVPPKPGAAATAVTLQSPMFSWAHSGVLSYFDPSSGTPPCQEWSAASRIGLALEVFFQVFPPLLLLGSKSLRCKNEVT